MDFFRFLDNRETYFRAIQEAARREYSYQHLSEAIEPTIVRKKYGIGGKVMLRGPMCPNFLEEHVIGNVRRGRLCTNAKDPDYVYYFDRQDRLVKVDKNTEVGVCTEYILSEGDMRFGFHFMSKEHWKNGIYAVLMEDGHIGATIWHSVIMDSDKPTAFDVWTFEYGQGRSRNVTSCYIKEGSEHSPSMIRAKNVAPSIRAAETIIALLMEPEASGWRAMLSTAEAPMRLIPNAAPMIARAAAIESSLRAEPAAAAASAAASWANAAIGAITRANREATAKTLKNLFTELSFRNDGVGKM